MAILKERPRDFISSSISDKDPILISISDNQEDQEVLFSILRDKIYSDKMLAIIREYITNAVDAHNEVGIPLNKIEITSPSALDSNFSVRDYGKGMSYEEISTTFTKYGKSTKRGTNSLIGTLGLGCKAGFAYTDTFLVTSYNNGTCSVYSLIDNKCILLSVTPSKETGIKITININEQDISVFNKKLNDFLFFWQPKDIPAGFTSYKNHGENLIEGNGWELITNIDKDFSSNIRFSHSSYGKIFIIMGNISYMVDTTVILKDLYSILVNFPYNTFLIINVPIGVLTFSASRESLENTKDNENYIKEKLDKDIVPELLNLYLKKYIKDETLEKRTSSILQIINSLKGFGIPVLLEKLREEIIPKDDCLRYLISDKYDKVFIREPLVRRDIATSGSKNIASRLSITKHKDKNLNSVLRYSFIEYNLMPLTIINNNIVLILDKTVGRTKRTIPSKDRQFIIKAIKNIMKINDNEELNLLNYLFVFDSPLNKLVEEIPYLKFLEEEEVKKIEFSTLIDEIKKIKGNLTSLKNNLIDNKSITITSKVGLNRIKARLFNKKEFTFNNRDFLLDTSSGRVETIISKIDKCHYPIYVTADNYQTYLYSVPTILFYLNKIVKPNIDLNLNLHSPRESFYLCNINSKDELKTNWYNDAIKNGILLPVERVVKEVSLLFKSGNNSLNNDIKDLVIDAVFQNGNFPYSSSLDKKIEFLELIYYKLKNNKDKYLNVLKKHPSLQTFISYDFDDIIGIMLSLKNMTIYRSEIEIVNKSILSTLSSILPALRTFIHNNTSYSYNKNFLNALGLDTETWDQLDSFTNFILERV